MPPVELVSAAYGHRAVFHAPTASPAFASDLTWGRSSISVPSSSPLNGPATIFLRVPNANLSAARDWCTRHKARFRGAWCPTASTPPQGFIFSVRGFSRYRYVESDEEEESGPRDPASAAATAAAAAAKSSDPSEKQPAAAPDPSRKPPRRGAQQTPARRAPRPHSEQDPTMYARPRLVTPRAVLVEDDDDDVDDDAMLPDAPSPAAQRWPGAAERTDVVTGERDGDSTDPADDIAAPDEVLPTSMWRGAPGADTVKMARLRNALFEELPVFNGEGEGGDILEDGKGGLLDVNMEDAPLGEYEDLQEAEERHFGMFASPEKDGEWLGDDDDVLEREAGRFAGEDTGRGRRGPAEMLFPETSLPFLSLEKSVTKEAEGTFMDTGLMLGRSTRMSFGGDGQFFRSCWRSAPSGMFQSDAFAVNGHDAYAASSQLPRSVFASVLRVHCVAWFAAFKQVDSESKPAEEPQRRIQRTPNLRVAFAQHMQVADATIEQIVEVLKNCDDTGDQNSAHAHVAFMLLSALYRDEGDEPFSSENNLLLRLATWALGPAGTVFDERPSHTGRSLRYSLLRLCVGSIEDAVSEALECGHLRLSLLIARALEAPKEDLRADAESQLVAYGLADQASFENDPDEREDSMIWDEMLQDCPVDASVTIDERMILLVLAGRVAPVARYLNFSWYRLFIMELLHGAGSSELTQAERVSAAVGAIAASGISTGAPHGQTNDTDVVYHLLRLYADPTASYPLTTGVYSTSSFGKTYGPLDARFSWLLYQVLTGVVPQAATARAPQMLADGFASQLRSAGLFLWSLYVLCSGGSAEHVIKETLIRDWPNMSEDYVEGIGIVVDTVPGAPNADAEMRGNDADKQIDGDDRGSLGAEAFITEVLGLPGKWISEAKAVAAYAAGNLLEGCEHWIACGTEDGALRAHEVLVEEVFPDVAAARDSAKFEVLTELLKKLRSSRQVSHWSTGGGLILDYLVHVVGVPTVEKKELDFYRGMVTRLKSMKERAKTAVQRYAASVIANGIAGVERAELFNTAADDRGDILFQLVDDLEKLPCTTEVKLRVAGEYRIEAEQGPSVALRYSTAYPPYARYLAPGSSAAG